MDMSLRTSFATTLSEPALQAVHMSVFQIGQFEAFDEAAVDFR
jgi:hypothetical protein